MRAVRTMENTTDSPGDVDLSNPRESVCVYVIQALRYISRVGCVKRYTISYPTFDRLCIYENH